MLTYFVIVPILVAVFLYVFPFEKAGKVIAIAIQAAFLGFAFYLFARSQGAEIITYIGNYHGVLGIVLRADTLAAVFILLTAFLFLMAAIFSFNEKNSRLFWLLMFLWEGSLIGIFLTRDLFNMFVLMEVAAVVITILIMFNRKERLLYDGLIYLMVNVAVVQLYLFGIGYVYKLTGTFDMIVAAEMIATVDRAELVLPYALIMTAIALKCALLPLYSWLPKAHGTPSAPAPVSALLSGLHIKSGLYLFLRVQDLFGEMALNQFFLVIGLVTAVVGIIMSLSQSDIKLMLAYSTVAQIGLITAGLNIADIGSYSYIGSLYHIINHALSKAVLFLSAGVIAYAYGTRDLIKIRGLLKRMPVIGGITIIAILGIIGMPLFNGSISKYFLVYDASPLLGWIINIINLGTILVFIKYSQIFLKVSAAEQGSQAIIKTDKYQQAALLVLGVLCLGGGIFGVQLIEFLFGVQVSVNLLGYLEKMAIFAGSLVIGYLLYKYFIKDSALLAKVRKIDLGFREICVCIGVFFAVILLVASVS